MKIKLVSLFLILSIVLTGCGSQAQPASETDSSGATFVDDLGRTVTVREPQRVACLLGSFAQIWQLAGGQVIATADDAWDDLGLELPEDCVNLGNTKELSLELLSRQFGYSEKYISYGFKKQFHIGLNAYLNAQRINFAVRLMERNHSYVKEIAERCGFRDQMYFSRLFKKTVGMSPLAYIRQCK